MKKKAKPGEKKLEKICETKITKYSPRDSQLDS